MDYFIGRLTPVKDDPAALAGAFSQIAATVVASPEFPDRFENKSAEETVRIVYRALFNREPEAGGLNFFTSRLEKGIYRTGDLPLLILGGAQGADTVVAANKLAAAQYFTTALDTPAEIAAYGGKAAAAAGRAFLAGIDLTLPAPPQLDALMNAALFPPADTGSSDGGNANPPVTPPAADKLRLTAGADIFSPTATDPRFRTTDAADTIKGDAEGQLSGDEEGGDDLNGGGGKDTLIATLTPGSLITPRLKSIETVELRLDKPTYSSSTGFNAAAAEGIETLKLTDIKIIDETSNSFTLNAIDPATAVTFDNLRIDDGKAGAMAGTLYITYKDGNSPARLSFTGGTGAASDDILTLLVMGAETTGPETLTLDSRSDSFAKSIQLIAADLKKLIVTGDKPVEIESLTLTEEGATPLPKTVDASALAAKFTYTASANGETITGSARADTITLGSGADRIVYTSANVGKDDISGFNPDQDKIVLRDPGKQATPDKGSIKIGTAGTTTAPSDEFRELGTNIAIRAASVNNGSTVYIDARFVGSYSQGEMISLTLIGVDPAKITKDIFEFA